jgi:hypothetical protein
MTVVELKALISDLKRKTTLDEDSCFEQCLFHANDVAPLVEIIEQLMNALIEVADYPLSDYGGVIARKALEIEE